MDENILSLTPEQLFERLHGAIVEGDLQQAGALAKAVDQQWAFAVVDRDSAKIHLLSRKLLEVATTAAAFEDHPPMSAWNQRWLVLSEMAELILAVDTTSAAEEDKKRIEKFEHAEKVLRFLNKERIGTLAEIQRAIGGAGTRQTTWNHVNRLVRSGMLTRVDEGVYRLTSRGQAVARLLAEEKLEPDEGISVIPEEIDLQSFEEKLREILEPSAQPIHRVVQQDMHAILNKILETDAPAVGDRSVPTTPNRLQTVAVKGQS